MNNHQSCGIKACVCPKCPDCGHRLEMKDPVRGCRVITMAGHKEHEANELCGCRAL